MDGETTMKTGLGPDELGDLLEQPIIGVLATRRPDDTTLLSPVWFDWRDGAFSIWPTPRAARSATSSGTPG
jgi:hypothetical protein